VIVFGVAMSPKAELTYVGPYSPSLDPATMRFKPSCEFAMERLPHLFVATIAFWGAAFLQVHGYNVFLAASGLPGLLSAPETQSKLCAYESGLGVYGRSGLILHPELGNRMSIGTILTDAVLAPDPRLTDFEPCQGCDLCVRMCPAQAFDASQAYPQAWSRQKCVSKTAEITAQGRKCNNCFVVCPAGKLKDEDLLCVEEKVSLRQQTRIHQAEVV
jgi:ferredoxin